MSRRLENSFLTASLVLRRQILRRKMSASNLFRWVYTWRLFVLWFAFSVEPGLIGEVHVARDIRRRLHLHLVFCVLKMALLMASGTMKNKDSKPEEDRPRSLEIFERGKKTLVGGVDSPVRAFRAVGGTPLVLSLIHI